MRIQLLIRRLMLTKCSMIVQAWRCSWALACATLWSRLGQG